MLEGDRVWTSGTSKPGEVELCVVEVVHSPLHVRLDCAALQLATGGSCARAMHQVSVSRRNISCHFFIPLPTAGQATAGSLAVLVATSGGSKSF